MTEPASVSVMPPDYLGNVTEARFAAAFAHKAIIPCAQAAALIGVDVDTLPSLPIRSVPRGKLRGYTERDLRAYLLEGAAEECQSTRRPRAAAHSMSSKIVPISALQGGRVDAARSRTRLRPQSRG